MFACDTSEFLFPKLLIFQSLLKFSFFSLVPKGFTVFTRHAIEGAASEWRHTRDDPNSKLDHSQAITSSIVLIAVCGLSSNPFDDTSELHSGNSVTSRRNGSSVSRTITHCKQPQPIENTSSQKWHNHNYNFKASLTRRGRGRYVCGFTVTSPSILIRLDSVWRR